MTGTAGPRFSSRIGFILATAGSAIGLGNIWRFPFVAGENGGGAFLCPYVVAVLLLGLPVMIIEIRAGQGSGRGVAGTFGMVSRWARWPGLVIAGTSLLLVSYYLVVTGWAIGYLGHGIVDRHPSFEGYTAGGNSVWYFLVAVALASAIVALGVNRGIEATSKVLMPVLLVVLIGLAIYGLTLPGRDAALRFYLVPDFSALGDPIVWVRAFGQAFFSVGVGMGVLITYGAYVPRGTNVARSSAAVAAADTAVAVLSGLVIFPLAFSFGSSPGSGPELAFDTLPRAFDSLGPITGYVTALLFYLALSAAAITSAVSLLETVVTALADTWKLRRLAGIVLVTTAALVVGLPSALSYAGQGLTIGGRPVLDVLDSLVGTLWLPIGVLLTVLVLGWSGARRSATGDGAGWTGVRLAELAARWLVPAAIAVVLGAMAFDLLRHRILPEGG